MGKNKSELLFEEYLVQRGLRDFQFEPEQEGSTRSPDYLVVFEGQSVLFEVKEFRSHDELDDAPKTLDPYRLIRRKINDARKKFKDLKGQSVCCLVLYNVDHPEIFLRSDFLFGAMLGSLGVEIPVGPDYINIEEAKAGFFGKDGQMIRYKDGEAFQPQNTTISAVIALEHFALGEKRFHIEIDRQEKEEGRKFTGPETGKKIKEAKSTPCDVSITSLRTIVCDNPFANMPLPPGIFRGPCDERFGIIPKTQRLFAGDTIVELEEARGGPELGPFWRAQTRQDS